MTLGRPSYIHDDQYDVHDLELRDIAHDQRAPAQLRDLSARTFIAAARLTVMLSDILSELYTVKGMKRLHALGISECCDVASAFFTRLEDWRRGHLEHLLECQVMYDPTGKIENHELFASGRSNTSQETYSWRTTPSKSRCVGQFSAPSPVAISDNVPQSQSRRSLTCSRTFK